MKKTTVIFDWAGTTVDFGSCAPVEVFLKIFEDVGIKVTYEEARKPMGMLKMDHIKTMLKMKRIEQEWIKKYNKKPTEEDALKLYRQFEKSLFDILKEFATPLPLVVDTVHTLRERGVNIGSTTGYTREMINIVSKESKKKGYEPDCIVTADEVGGFGRPSPYMIFENMKLLNVQDVREVIKVGDTEADIKEGLHAGVYTIGVIIGSSEMGLTKTEFDQLTVEERINKIEETKHKFESYGAHATIETIDELVKFF